MVHCRGRGTRHRQMRDRAFPECGLQVRALHVHLKLTSGINKLVRFTRLYPY